jgi:hypothetical protein
MALAVAEVVEHRDLVAGVVENGGDGAADVACAAGDEDVHGNSRA